MKVLVATKRTQGQRESDFCFVMPGLPVYLGFMCDRDRREGADGGCGCGRAFTGTNSKGTTTAVVKDVDWSLDDYVRKIGKAMERDGWEDSARARAQRMLVVATPFSVDDVVERRGEFVFKVRKEEA